MFKAYKYRLCPTKEQASQIDQHLGCCRLIYNLGLTAQKYAHSSGFKRIHVYELQKQLTDLRNEYDWIKNVSRQCMAAALVDLDNSYKRFFMGDGFPRYKRKIGRQSCKFQQDVKVNFELSTVRVTKIGHIQAIISKRFSGKVKHAVISREPTGKYFISVCVDDGKLLPEKPVINRVVGLDVGIKTFVVSSDGSNFEANKKLKNNLSRLIVLQRRLSKKKKGSKNRDKARLAVAVLHEKITNQRSDYIHKITHQLTHDSQVDTLVIEDLNVAGMVKNHKLARSISDAAFGEFFRQLKYKCDWYGKNLITIGRFEPSSKTCNDCGAINQALTLADREWTCACGSTHDRDLNAAKNIRDIGLKKYSPVGSRGGPVEQSALMGCNETGNAVV